MGLSLYQWVYILTNIFLVYTIYKLMKVFFDVRRASRRVEWLTYMAYGVVVTIMYFLLNIPAVLIAFNLAAFFALTYNYEATFKKRFLSAILAYFILMLIEFIGVLPFDYYSFSLFAENTYASIYGLIVCRIFSFVAALILSNFKNIRKGEEVPNSNWLCILVIPMASLYLHLLLFYAKGLAVGHIFAGVVLLFLINFVAFYLYDAITAAMAEKMQNLLILEQNKYYEKQFELIKASLRTTNSIKHDLKNHMFAIRALTEENRKDEVLRYISKIMADVGANQNLAASGNAVIDSIINFKFQEAEQGNIETSLELKIPETLEVPSFDMTIILGNLLDNAIEAASKAEGRKYLDLKVKYDKGRLLIQSDNPFAGEVIEENGKLLTSKEDERNHGLGLENIKKVMQKYNGTTNINYNGNHFSVSLLMYVD